MADRPTRNSPQRLEMPLRVSYRGARTKLVIDKYLEGRMDFQIYAQGEVSNELDNGLGGFSLWAGDVQQLIHLLHKFK